MGNFSRDTFDPIKNYVGVRLQQGVPLVDADWNELNDVIREELHTSIAGLVTTGVKLSTDDLTVVAATPPGNNFVLRPGTAFIEGRVVQVREAIVYNEQPWTNREIADRDEVDIIPQLTIFEAQFFIRPRQDIVYLDVWEREVNSNEDPEVIDGNIGIETCVRLKREIAVRVSEGSVELPEPPENHLFMPVAILNRSANESEIDIESIEDIRSSIYGIKEILLFPAFLPVFNQPEWNLSFSGGTGFGARRPSNPRLDSVGILPISLPVGSKVIQIRIRTFSTLGPSNRPNLTLEFIRTPYELSGIQSELEVLSSVESEVNGFDDYIITLPTRGNRDIVSNGFIYALTASIEGGATGCTIRGISISYESST